MARTADGGPYRRSSIAVVAARFVHYRREELVLLLASACLAWSSGFKKLTHLSLVSRRRTRGKHTLLDISCSEMVQHGVVRHDQHGTVVFHRRCAVQNALAQEHGEGWGCGL